MTLSFRIWPIATCCLLAPWLAACSEDVVKTGHVVAAVQSDGGDANTLISEDISLTSEDIADTGAVAAADADPIDSMDADTALDTGVKTGCSGAGCACTDNKDCDNGFCIETSLGHECASKCVDDCGDGFQCMTTDGGNGDLASICVPSFPRLCEPCLADSDCSNALGGGDSRCVQYQPSNGPNLGSFCATGCAGDAGCPDGYACKAVKSTSGVAGNQCVRGDLACPCDNRAVTLKLATHCSSVGPAGTCQGLRTCGAAGLSACDAPAAMTETCNQQDDDCDGQTDETTVGLCDDGQACTLDACANGACLHGAQPGTCDDASACTTGDLCGNGTCAGTPIACDDGNPCTQDACEALSGCSHAFVDGGACSDGSVCTTGDLCLGGACLPGAASVCDDANPCSDDSCDKTKGCVAIANAVPCSDGDSCTTGDTCANSACGSGSAVVCDDNNVCTTDSCDKPSGTCKSVANTSACDDNDKCTDTSVCANGVCTGTAKKCDDGKACTVDGCDAATGACKAENAVDGLICDDASACTQKDACSAGACVGADLVCDDGNPCTGDTCDTKFGCQFKALADKSACDDGDGCTTADACATGKCLGQVKSCTDDNPCTTDTCVSNACVNKANSNPCNDGNACTLDDKCNAASECKGLNPLKCLDNNPCTDDTCASLTGCIFPNNTIACEDGQFCTVNEACKNGNCTGGVSNPCDDASACTNDSCDGGKKACVHAAKTASIATQADADSYAGCVTLAGISVQAGQTGLNIKLPLLKTVTGNLYFHQVLNLQSVALPALESVGGMLYFHGNTALSTLDVSALLSVGGYLYLHGNTALSTFAVGSIASVGAVTDPGGNPGYTYIGSNTSLCVQPGLSVWQSVTKGSVSISGNKAGCP